MNNLERADNIQKVAQLYMQGRKNPEIARELQVSETTVKNYLLEWENYIKTRAEKEPDLLDKVLENTISFLENYDYILKEAWEVYEDAKLMQVAATRLQSLKLIHELTSQKARLVNLLGPRLDMRSHQKARRAERVNEFLSQAMRNVIADCENCRPRLWDELQKIYMDIQPEQPEGVIPELEEQYEVTQEN